MERCLLAVASIKYINTAQHKKKEHDRFNNRKEPVRISVRGCNTTLIAACAPAREPVVLPVRMPLDCCTIILRSMILLILLLLDSLLLYEVYKVLYHREEAPDGAFY